MLLKGHDDVDDEVREPAGDKSADNDAQLTRRFNLFAQESMPLRQQSLRAIVIAERSACVRLCVCVCVCVCLRVCVSL